MEQSNVPEIYLRVGRVRVFVSARPTPAGYHYRISLGRLSPRNGSLQSALASYDHNLPELAERIELIFFALKTGIIGGLEDESELH